MSNPFLTTVQKNMLYPFSQIISLSYSACADDMGHLERTEQKINLATGVACFLPFFASFFFATPVYTAPPGTFYRCKTRILRQEKTRLVRAVGRSENPDVLV